MASAVSANRVRVRVFRGLLRALFERERRGFARTALPHNCTRLYIQTYTNRNLTQEKRVPTALAPHIDAFYTVPVLYGLRGAPVMVGGSGSELSARASACPWGLSRQRLHGERGQATCASARRCQYWICLSDKV